ncbi:MAG TPA: hypothetical protein VH637_07925 [Streptosporangiaceae bacterium]
MIAGGPQQARESELAKAVTVVAGVWLLTVLSQVIIYAHAFRRPLVSFGVWLALVAAAAWLLPRARARGLTGFESAAAITVAVAAVAVVGWDRRLNGATGSVDWSVVGTGWLLALVAVSRRAWEWICGALLVFAAHAVFAIRVLGVTQLGLARLAVTIEALVVVLVAFAALRPTWRTEARITERRALLAHRTAAEHAADEAVSADRRRRRDVLEADALPLLRGIAEGWLDPADSEVIRRCAQHAATLRAALTGQEPEPGGLLAALRPALAAAAARGVQAQTQLVGDPGSLSPVLRSATVTVVERVLSALPPQQVTITVLGSDQDAELYLTFAVSPPARLELPRTGRSRPPAGWHAALDAGDEGPGCLEVRWRKPAVAPAAREHAA